MVELNTCPLCLNQVSHTDDDCHCEACNSDFSIIADNAVLVEHVGFVPQKEWVVLSD
jgi:hypothetical protein